MNFESVTTFFKDNNPNGVRVCKKAGSVIDAYIIPRRMIKDAKELGDEVYRHGIYFLMDDGNGIAMPKMYAGKTENGIERLCSHKYTKDFWDLAVMFLADDVDFHLDVISALEKFAIDGVVKSNQYESENKIDPKVTVSKYQRQIVERYFADIKFVMSWIGYSLDPVASGDKGDWHTTRNGVVAYGRYSSSNFDVLPGSQVNMSKAVNCDAYNKLRKQLIDAGLLIQTGKGVFTLKKVVPFKTPSGASDFVLGGSTNGWGEWKNDQGKPLDVLRK